MSTLRRAFDSLGTGAVVLLALCAAVLTLGNIRRDFFPSSTMLTEPVDSVANWTEFASRGSRLGPERAPATLVVFSDYECPTCFELFVRLDVITHVYPADVAVIWRHLPLAGHRNALQAARASVCAAWAGRFEAMHRVLFTAHDSLGLVPWTTLAAAAGVQDTSAFGACLRSDSAQHVVDADLAAAAELHAFSTPTVLVNGLKYFGVPPDLRRIVRFVVRHAPTRQGSTKS